MLVANSFDLWKKDAFFSAAEEVQDSTDIMESAYRTWARVRREGLTAQDLEELFRELQTALGTAKWQLDEFERAVRLSSRNCSDDITTIRHRQFVDAIENQISSVEAALRKSFNEEGKQPLQWVNLNEEEYDDFAVFLSGTPRTSQTMKDECVKLETSTKSSFQETQYMKKPEDLNVKIVYKREISSQTEGFKDVGSIVKDSELVIKLEPNKIPQTGASMNCQADRSGTIRTWSSPDICSTRKTCSSQDIGGWKIVIADEDEQKMPLSPNIEATPKEKGPKRVFSKQFNQILGRVVGCHGQIQRLQHLQFSCSVQFMLALMLTICLIVPFVLYSM